MDKDDLEKLAEIVVKIKADFADTYDVSVSDICLHVSPTGYLHLYTENKEGEYSDHFCRYLPVAGGGTA